MSKKYNRPSAIVGGGFLGGYEELKAYRRRAIIAATDLMYDKVIIEKIKAAKSCSEISRIMRTARMGGEEE